MTPRIIHLPVSGGDRKHYMRELTIAQQKHAALVRRLPGAYRTADEHLQLANRMACEEWNARQFIGGPAEPSPTLAQAIHGGCILLEVRCRQCCHTEFIDLTEVIWPRENGVESMRRALSCQECKKQKLPRSRPDLVALRMPEPPQPEPPAAAVNAKRR